MLNAHRRQCDNFTGVRTPILDLQCIGPLNNSYARIIHYSVVYAIA